MLKLLLTTANVFNFAVGYVDHVMECFRIKI